MTPAPQEALEGLVGPELDRPFSVVDPLENPDARPPVEFHRRARPDPLGGPQQRLPPGRGRPFAAAQQQDLDGGTRRLSGEEPRRDHLRVVDDEHVTLPEHLRELQKNPVL